MKNLYIFLLIILANLNATASKTNYFEYYSEINKAEVFITAKKYVSALTVYNKVLFEFEKPFVSDCYIAAQVAIAQKDIPMFYKMISLAFKNGMPLTALPAANILKSIINDTVLSKKIDSLYLINSRYFIVNDDEIDNLRLMSYLCDSLKVAYGKSRPANIELLKKETEMEEIFREFVVKMYLKKGIFPSEKVTGIATDEKSFAFRKKLKKVDLYPKSEMDQFFKSANSQTNTQTIKLENEIKQEYDLSSTLAFNIFIHSTCTIQKYEKELWECVKNGYLHPKEFCMVEEMCISWNREGDFSKYSEICNYNKKEAYYNVLAFNPFKSINTFVNDGKGIEIVEKNRKDKFLQSYKIDLLKKGLEKSEGFKFFFGFMGYR